jgi:hypothetical protein
MVTFARAAGALAVLTGVAVGLSAAPIKETGDLLAAGSKWNGTLTQKGQIRGNETPLKLDAVLTVTKRDGSKFEAELFEQNEQGIRLTYLVRGEVTRPKDGKGFALSFQSYDVKNADSQTFINIPYTGKLTGGTIKGTWKHPANDENTTIEGDFTLELVR